MIVIFIVKSYIFIAERVKDEHEKFLLIVSFESPRLMNIPREKIVRWHPEFDVESCKKIEQAELPHPPVVETPSAKNVLDKNYEIFLHLIIKKKYDEKLIFFINAFSVNT